MTLKSAHKQRNVVRSDERDKVFVVHGLNHQAKDEMYKFLRALNLKPLDWHDVVSEGESTYPSNLYAVKVGIQAAKAVVVLITPDELVQLRRELVQAGDTQSGYQARPNVIIEAGIAIGAKKPNEMFLVQVGKTREQSDLAGINYVRLRNSKACRDELVSRLTQAGCRMNLAGRYRVAGDFDQVLPVEQGESHFLELGVVRGDDIFYAGVAYLKEHSRGDVLIYAPTGVWEASTAKATWFCTVATCLANDQKQKRPRCRDKSIASVKTKLGNFIGVYGLPYKLGPLPENKRAEVSAHLDIMEELFKPFDGLSTAHLRYLETDTETIPGTGAIIIDYSSFLGFAIAMRPKVDYGLWFGEQVSVTKDIRSWFTHHVGPLCEDNIIHDTTRKVSLRQGMDALRLAYGLTGTK